MFHTSSSARAPSPSPAASARHSAGGRHPGSGRDWEPRSRTAMTEIAVTRARKMGSLESHGDDQGSQQRKDHLYILAHGLQMFPGGGVSSLDFLRNSLRESVADAVVYVATSNLGFNTLDGIDAGGRRLADEVRAVVSSSTELKKISFIGFSLGGLHCRYAIGVLFDTITGTICGLTPSNFVSMASPHLGLRNLMPLGAVAHFLASVFLGSTGKQLFMLDGESPEQGILHSLTLDGDLPFITAIQSFQHRMLYANTCADFQVGGWEAAPHDAMPRPSEGRGGRRFKGADTGSAAAAAAAG
jgi:hypothetical protein